MNLIVPLSEPITLTPVPISKLKELRGLLLKIMAAWLQNEFAVGDTVMDGKTWGLMKKAIAMLPREGGGEFSDLDSLANNYEWIEQTFFAQKKAVRVESVEVGGETIKTWRFDITEYEPGTLVKMHLFDHMKLLREANESL
jgi:hypothetical protein